MNYTNRKQASDLAVLKLTSSISSLKESESEARLIFSILSQAVNDLTYPVRTLPTFNHEKMSPYESAVAYLYDDKEIDHAELIGLNTDYVRKIIRDCFNYFGESPVCDEFTVSYNRKKLNRANLSPLSYIARKKG
jgi:hypothetical protein